MKQREITAERHKAALGAAVAIWLLGIPVNLLALAQIEGWLGIDPGHDQGLGLILGIPGGACFTLVAMQAYRRIVHGR